VETLVVWLGSLFPIFRAGITEKILLSQFKSGLILQYFSYVCAVLNSCIYLIRYSNCTFICAKA